MSCDNSDKCASILISGTTFHKEDQEFLDYIGVVYSGNISIENCVLNDISYLNGFKSIEKCVFNYKSFENGTILDMLGSGIITPYNDKNNQIDMFNDGDDLADWWKQS